MLSSVVEVDDRKSWRQFLELPRRIYRDDPVWVPALDAEVRKALDARKNPYFRDAALGLFGYRRGGRMVARVAVVLHPGYRGSNGCWPALFGFFESEHDPEAVGLLFEAVTRWTHERGGT